MSPRKTRASALPCSPGALAAIAMEAAIGVMTPAPSAESTRAAYSQDGVGASAVQSAPAVNSVSPPISTPRRDSEPVRATAIGEPKA